MITRVKGRFYYSHGRANALIQRRGTVPSGCRREEGRNLPSTCWNGFKADFTPSTGGPSERGRTEPGWQEPPGRSHEGEMLLSTLRCFPGVCCPGQEAALGWGAGGTKKVTITLFLLVLFLTTFLFLFIYFVVGLLLSIFLVLLGKTKHHLKKMHWGREKGEEMFSRSAHPPPFLPKAKHQPTGAPGAHPASCLPPHDAGSPGTKDQV